MTGLGGCRKSHTRLARSCGDTAASLLGWRERLIWSPVDRRAKGFLWLEDAMTWTRGMPYFDIILLRSG
jgi:hypothetical protein